MSWTTIPKPNQYATTSAGAATGLIIPPTYNTAHTLGIAWSDVAKPSSISEELIFNGSFGGNTDGWTLSNYTYANSAIQASSSTNDALTDDGTGSYSDNVLFNGTFTGNATGWDLTTFTYGSNRVNTTTGGSIQTNSGYYFNIFQDKVYHANIQGQNTVASNVTITVANSLGTIMTNTQSLSGAWGVGITFTPSQSYTNCYLNITAASNFNGFLDNETLKYALGTNYTFDLAATTYELEFNVGGTTGNVEAIIYGDNGVDFDQTGIAAGSGKVSYQFTSTGDTNCYLEIYSNDSFNGTISEVSLKALPEWTYLSKATTIYTWATLTQPWSSVNATWSSPTWTVLNKPT